MHTDTITISTNYWKIPSAATALDGFLEGSPSEEERANIVAAAKAAHRSWNPKPEAFELVEQLQRFVGSRIRIQFWDSCMMMFEQEGPFPVEGNCTGVILKTDGEFVQAYIQVEELQEKPTRYGYSPVEYFQEQEGSQFLLAPVSSVYEVTRV